MLDLIVKFIELNWFEKLAVWWVLISAIFVYLIIDYIYIKDGDDNER